jgi:N6-adenosine-specific RNA methylase IME4
VDAILQEAAEKTDTSVSSSRRTIAAHTVSWIKSASQGRRTRTIATHKCTTSQAPVVSAEKRNVASSTESKTFISVARKATEQNKYRLLSLIVSSMVDIVIPYPFVRD